MNGSGVGVGLLWAASGALPVAAVAPIWSSYYYLYAMCGAALAIAALGARLPRSAMIAMLAILATLSARAGAREEFATAPGAWTTQSHVTRFYIERAATIRGQMLDEMRRARPTLPHRSTLFFGSVPSNIGWQAGDGPLVRWAYRDSSLRSYFLNQFSYPRAKRGPICFFTMEGGHLKEIWKGDSSYTALAINMMIDDHPDCSRDAIQIAIENGTTNNFDSFMLVWLDIEAGRMDEARARLARLGLGIAEGQAPELLPAMKAIREGADTLRVMASVSQGLARHPFDAGSHGFLADLLLIRGGLTPSAEVEAFASRVLAPDAPWGWRRWAQIQVGTTRYRQAALSLDRYFALAGPGGDGDAEAKAMREELKRWLPGGELTQRALRESASATGAASPAGGP